jgi:hypothetical protein
MHGVRGQLRQCDYVRVGCVLVPSNGPPNLHYVGLLVSDMQDMYGTCCSLLLPACQLSP